MLTSQAPFYLIGDMLDVLGPAQDLAHVVLHFTMNSHLISKHREANETGLLVSLGQSEYC